MDTVKIPKKLQDICKELRSGNISDGLEALNKFDKLEIQKNAILAEIRYFSSEFEKAIEYDKAVFPYWEQWRSGNIFQEHLAAFTFAAMKNNLSGEAVAFYELFLENKMKEEELKPHQKNYFKLQINRNIEILTNGFEKYINEDKYEKKETGKSLSEFMKQLKDKRPELLPDSIEAADYILNFIYADGRAEDYIELYEKFAQTNDFNSDHHLNAAKIYIFLNESDKAKKAVLNYAEVGWHPVEHTQVMPMTLFSKYSLYELLTKDFLNKLMIIPKGQ